MLPLLSKSQKKSWNPAPKSATVCVLVTSEVNAFVTFEKTDFPFFRMNTATLVPALQTSVPVLRSVAQVVMVAEPPGFPRALPQTE